MDYENENKIIQYGNENKIWNMEIKIIKYENKINIYKNSKF